MAIGNVIWFVFAGCCVSVSAQVPPGDDGNNREVNCVHGEVTRMDDVVVVCNRGLGKGLVCADDGWNNMAASVVCRQLNPESQGGEAGSRNNTSADGRPFVVQKLECNGQETSLISGERRCDYGSVTNNTECASNKIATVMCKPDIDRPPSEPEEEPNDDDDSSDSGTGPGWSVSYPPDQDTTTFTAEFQWSFPEFELEQIFEIRCRRRNIRNQNQITVQIVEFDFETRRPRIVGLLPDIQYNCTILADGEIIPDSVSLTIRQPLPPGPPPPRSGMQVTENIEIWIVAIIVAALFLVMTVVWIGMCVLMYRRSRKIENRYSVTGQEGGSTRDEYRMANRPVPTLPQNSNLAAQMYEPVPDPTYEFINQNRTIVDNSKNEEERKYHVLERGQETSTSTDHTYHVLEDKNDSNSTSEQKSPEEEDIEEECAASGEEAAEYEVPTSSVSC